MNYYDYIIVGGGASGLMMAYRMSKDTFFDDKTILILDKEKKTLNDRTWCYWEDKNDEWNDVVTISWNTIIFKSDVYKTEQVIAPYQYKMIQSKDFYLKIWNHLEQKTNFTFQSKNVTSIHQLKGEAEVITSNQVFKTKKLINSILFNNEYKEQTKYPVLQQHFVGFFIKTKEDTFDDNAATFMDFTVAQNGNTRFMYILPYKKNEALFEYTLFSEDLLKYEEYKLAIEKYLESKNITDYEIVDKEQGSIPMTCYKFWEQNSENIIHIGTAGGWSKASTGFTFKNTTKKTAELIVHLKQNKSLERFHKINKFWFYDLLLLDILHEKNHLGAVLFSDLFKRTPSKRILKFLDEETSLFEDLQVILKMPPKNFIRAIYRRIF
ncbi:lycopene cyclase family protein [Polaribacter glomeratus]|uniref:Lycopene cyclase n=1 Tax=Polaribacter glomeratus TaxID=102 RepID=A0A2S7WXF2_9FLAO|nr:lycopene cyclase family protein [Polaribacter glomeratus]PQJ82081.1 lycopene cyclase [Polaribacter glomeratus]